MLAMIKFGADEIFTSRDSTVTDADIDKILAKGEEKTATLSEKLQKSNLLDFSLDSGKIDDCHFYRYEDR